MLNDSKINRKDMIEFDDGMKTLQLDNFNVNMYLMRFQKLRKDFRFPWFMMLLACQTAS